MVYRASPPTELLCPRCKKRKLPPVDVAACKCGTWVTSFVADVVLTELDRKPDPVTRWWRVLEPCPVCNDKMLLHGDEPGLLLGCAGHGFWIDADTIEHTGLARPYDLAALERKRADEDAVAADNENRQRAEQQRAEERLTRERAEAAVRQLMPRRTYEARAAESQLSREATAIAASKAEAEAAFVATLEPMMQTLWRRVAELERKNAVLERRVLSLERS